MTETDLDTDATLAETEEQVRLPWESIDPDPVEESSHSTSTDVRAVDREWLDRLFGKLSGTSHPVNRFNAYEDDDAIAAASEERDEWFAAHTFFPDEMSEPKVVSATDPGSLVPVLCEKGWSEGPGAESFDPSDSNATGSPEADFTEFSSAVAEMEAELHNLLTGPSPDPTELATRLNSPKSEVQASPQSKGEREPISDSTDAESLSIEATPWATFDAALPDASNLVDDTALIPAHVIADDGVTFSTYDSLLTAASELATLAESFAAQDVEETDEPMVAVSVHPADTEGVFVVPELQPSVEAQTAAQIETELEVEHLEPAVTTGGGWTIPLMCLGIGLIACCVVIPQGESNRQLRYEQSQLQANLQNVQKQVAVNDAFLKNVSDDPTLAERLAGRQMKTIRKGQKVVPLTRVSGENESDMSPFALVAIAPPPEIPAYQPKRGTVADLCNNARSRLYLMGAALTMVAVGLVMGFSPQKD